MSKCVQQWCYGCILGRESGSKWHNLCSLHTLDQIRFCIYYALDSIDDAAVMEQYGNEVGLAALEWADIFEPEYRRITWMSSEDWFNDMTSLVFEKLEHPPCD